MISNSNTLVHYIGATLAYYSLLFASLLFAFKFNIVEFDFTPIWDIEHYLWIANNCYCDFRLVFFPGFSWLWRILDLGIIYISLFNGLMFIFSSSFLAFFMKMNLNRFVVLNSSISGIFFFIPYSESLFYLFVSIGVIGLIIPARIIGLGFFGASITRSASTLFILSSIASCIKFNKTRFIHFEKYELIKTGKILFFSMLGLVIIGVLNYIESDSAFSFYEYQKIWDNKIGLPTLPFRTWGSGIAHQLDFLALASVCILTVVALNRCSIFKANMIYRYSFWYLVGFTLITLMYRGGSLHSFNRFVFCSPFFLVLGSFALDKVTINKNRILILFFGLVILSLLFGSYVHIQVFLKYIAASIYLIVFIVAANQKKISPISIFALLINIVIFIWLYNSFYLGEWIG